MFNATSGVQSTNPLSLNISATKSGNPVDSFAQQLASAIEGYLGKAQNGSHFEIDVQSGQDQSFTVSVKNLGTKPAATAPAAQTPESEPVAIDPLPTSLFPSPAGTTAASKNYVPAASAPAAAATAVVDKSNMTPTDAYWAEQPPAIQALRTMPDDERFAAAQELAKQGYSIDVPIMVWGWDPLTTMTIRQNDGYTWVPSALQPNTTIGPGIVNVWNLPSYDPNHPPPGSIKVSTDFAIGTNMQDPYIKSLSST